MPLQSAKQETYPHAEIAIAIPLPNGQVCLISREDNDLSTYAWHMSTKGGYVQRKVKEDEKRKYIFLHREIAQRIIGGSLTHSIIVEHENGNKLDNRRQNILPLTAAESTQRHNIRRSNKSGYRGVYYNKSEEKWVSSITVNKRKIHLGYYNDPKCAAKAYNEAAIKYYGEDAKLNIIQNADKEDFI